MHTLVFTLALTLAGIQDAGDRPAPRRPDGRVELGSAPGAPPGLWVGNGGRLAVNPDSYEPRTTLNAPIHIDDVPIQAWARALTNDRHAQFLSYEPHARCKPSGGPREFVTPYGFEILDLPELERILIFDIGGPHTYRIVFMDGREHPQDLSPSYYGHSIGRWEGETLVIDTVGFNERFWMNRDGIPHTDRLHLVERFMRPDHQTLQYEVTIDDPGTFTDEWTTGFTLSWTEGEIWEYVCQDNNSFADNIVDSFGEPEPPSRIVP